jgi:alkanesulfonate monooxygenase SsuD/methylene tetrahydromethanopterin reductase-like flavin-dependent oxidoreductase (luciferase family)
MSTVAGAGLVERRDHPWVQNQRREPRFGLAWAPFPDPDWATGRDLVQMAEALGYDSYWCMDHPTHAVDCWTRLAALATCTRTIRLGPLVSCVHFRSPAMLARVAADVDRLGDGRLVLGVGIGDLPWEFERLGLPFAETSVRQAALEKASRSASRARTTAFRRPCSRPVRSSGPTYRS